MPDCKCCSPKEAIANSFKPPGRPLTIRMSSNRPSLRDNSFSHDGSIQLSLVAEFI
jgi:hypothetical protein